MIIDSVFYKVLSIAAGVVIFMFLTIYLYGELYISGGIAFIIGLFTGAFFFIVYHFYALVLERLENIEKLLQPKDN
jgi:hypothetical protein